MYLFIVVSTSSPSLVVSVNLTFVAMDPWRTLPSRWPWNASVARWCAAIGSAKMAGNCYKSLNGSTLWWLEGRNLSNCENWGVPRDLSIHKNPFWWLKVESWLLSRDESRSFFMTDDVFREGLNPKHPSIIFEAALDLWEGRKGHGTSFWGSPFWTHPFPLAARITRQHVPAGSTKVSLWRRTRFFQPNWSYKRPLIAKWKGVWNQQPMGVSPSFPTQKLELKRWNMLYKPHLYTLIGL